MFSSSPTSLAPQALTTPFIPPNTLNCADQYITTSFTTSRNYSTTTINVLASISGVPNFASCQPTGWNQGPTPNLEFSPAVCPAGWTAYEIARSEKSSWSDYTIGTEVTSVASYTTLTTAYCCSSGFSLAYDIISLQEISLFACLQDINPSSTPLPTSFRVHNPWHITWEAPDISSLTPSPPNLGCASRTATLSTWVPGSPVDDTNFNQGGCTSPSPSTTSGYDGPSESEGHFQYKGLFYFLAIGMPIIVVVAVIGCISCCCHRRHKRLDKLEVTSMQARHQGGVVVGGGETGEENPPAYEAVGGNLERNDDIDPPPYKAGGGDG